MWGLRTTKPGQLWQGREIPPPAPGQPPLAQRDLPWLGEDFLSGPKGLMGKGPAMAKWGLSLYPQARDSWTKAGSWTPTAPRPLPSSRPPGSLPVWIDLGKAFFKKRFSFFSSFRFTDKLNREFPYAPLPTGSVPCCYYLALVWDICYS